MKAILLNLSAWTMLPIMDGIAKYLSSSLPVLQITWARYFFTVVIILPTMVFFFKKNLRFSEKPKLQIIRPGLIEFNLATFAALGTGFMYGFYLIVTRKLSNVDNPLLTLLFTGIVGAFIGSFAIPFYWVMPSLEQWIFLFLIGFFASIGHLLLILSLKLADASKLAPFGYFEILPNVIIGFYFFNNVPDLFHVAGLFLIIGSGVYIFRKEAL